MNGQAKAKVGWVIRRAMLTAAVFLAAGWLPAPWGGLTAWGVLFILAATRRRRLGRRIYSTPAVRAAAAWLVVPPEKKGPAGEGEA